MGNVANAPINELVTLTESVSPELLASLRDRYPKIAKHFEGKWLGATENSMGISRELAAAAMEMLEAVDHSCVDALGVATARISKQRTLRLVAEASSLSGVVAVIGALGLQKPTAAIVSAAVSLLANLGRLLADFYRVAPGGGGSSAVSVQVLHQRMYESLMDVRVARSEIEVLIKHTDSAAELGKAVGKANALARKINIDIAAFLVSPVMRTAHRKPTTVQEAG